MSILSADRILNIKRSLNLFLYEHLGASYFITYAASTGSDTLQRRLAAGGENHWKWMDVFWLNVGGGDFSVSRLQINCNTVITEDPLRISLMEMVDDVHDQLNVNSIPMFDFSSDPENPAPTDNVLVPRFQSSKPMKNEGQDTVNVEMLDYKIFVYRESVLP